MRIVDTIDLLRQVRGYSKSTLEIQAGLTDGRICKWLAGKGSPSMNQILAIADALDVTPEMLIIGDGDELPEVMYKPSRPMTDQEQTRLLEICSLMGYLESVHRLLTPSLPTIRSQRARYRKRNQQGPMKHRGAPTAAAC